jgi:thiosulfate dehydrogenase
MIAFLHSVSVRPAFAGAAMAACAAVNVMASANVARATDRPQFDVARWTRPDIGAVADDENGELIKYGYALITDTANQIGPDVTDPTKRYSGNNLTCQSCHLNAGTQANGLSLAGVPGQFPQYRGREGVVGTLEDRIDGCMERSLNGRSLPPSSREMKAYLAFMKWLSSGIPDGAKLLNAGTAAIKEPRRAADLAHGKQVFEKVCAVCHGPNGRGERAAAGSGYRYPPLWGPDSFNNGAGMARVLTAAAFIKNNMPFGTTFAAPVLSDEDAYDVAGFVDNADRPQKADLDRDYPNRLQKPVDAPYGPYADNFDPIQHKLGPFDPIRSKLRELTSTPATPP